MYGVLCYVLLHGSPAKGRWELLPLQWAPSHCAGWRLLGWCGLILWWVVHYCAGTAFTRGSERTWVIQCVMQICPKVSSIPLNLVAHVEAGSFSYHIYPLQSAWDVLVVGTDVLRCCPESRPRDRAPIFHSQSFEEACALPSALGSWLWSRIVIELCFCAAARWGSGKVSFG